MRRTSITDKAEYQHVLVGGSLQHDIPISFDISLIEKAKLKLNSNILGNLFVGEQLCNNVK